MEGSLDEEAAHFSWGQYSGADGIARRDATQMTHGAQRVKARARQAKRSRSREMEVADADAGWR
jgi:hypothetical protein